MRKVLILDAKQRYLHWSVAMAGVAAAILILETLLRYRSPSNTRVLGMWSEGHAMLIVLVVVLLFWLLLRIRKEHSSRIAAPGRSLWARFFGCLGIFIWASSMFLDSLEDSRAGGRIADLVFFGGQAPATIFLEWLSMVLLFIAFVLAVEGWLGSHIRPEGATSRRSQDGLLLLTSVVAVFLLLEGGTRALHVANPVTEGFPSKSSALWNRYFVRFNSLGYRDKERSIQPLGRTKRILIIGDSFTFGAGIEDPEQRLGERLERALNRLSGGLQFEVINAGTPNTHTLHHIETLRRMLVYRPDWVLLLYVFNDIEHVTGPAAPVISKDGMWGRFHPLRLLVLNSQFSEHVFLRLRAAVNRYQWDESEWARNDPYRIEATLEPHLRALERFFELCQEAKVEARLIPFDIGVQFLKESAGGRYGAFVGSVTARGIPVWSLAEAFEGYRYTDLAVNHLDGHPNALANELAAKVVIDRLQTEFLRSRSYASGDLHSIAERSIQ